MRVEVEWRGIKYVDLMLNPDVIYKSLLCLFSCSVYATDIIGYDTEIFLCSS